MAAVTVMPFITILHIVFKVALKCENGGSSFCKKRYKNEKMQELLTQMPLQNGLSAKVDPSAQNERTRIT